ncbi:MAG: VWA domain-containing protein [Myxococcales bacterium]|nr:VWA domain-containing protein [Myxococcales bacterium]MCB9735518.1 VWA domain-containing protein [Deltaproteobacteria bacterium]
MVAGVTIGACGSDASSGLAQLGDDDAVASLDTGGTTPPEDTTAADSGADDVADTAGGCDDAACTGGMVCVAGACACPAGLDDCDGTCVDFARDPVNCGGCGLAPRDELCNGKDDDCDGDTDEGFVDPVSGRYERDDACGSCSVDCTADLDVDHGYGRCDATGAAPVCALVCCTEGDAERACDGFDYANSNGEVGDGCEERLGRACGTTDDCPDHQVCDEAGVCQPNEVGGPCGVDVDCAEHDRCFAGICGCAGDTIAAEAVPPNVLLVLDRSGSMASSPTGGSGRSKWDIAKDAIEALTQGFEDRIRFGLMLYPGTNQSGSQGQQCGAGRVFIDPGPDNASAINTFIGGAGRTGFGTPTAEALEWLLDYSGLEDPSRENVVVVITDGVSSCDDPIPQVTALRDQSPSIRTFVIGFDGTGNNTDPDELNGMADAGGTALAGDTRYYAANDATSLGEALEAIAGDVLGCNFRLSGVPPTLSSLQVFIDKAPIARDATHGAGWDYASATNQVTFYGPACQALLDGAVQDLVFIYGCPVPDIGQ